MNWLTGINLIVRQPFWISIRAPILEATSFRRISEEIRWHLEVASKYVITIRVLSATARAPRILLRFRRGYRNIHCRFYWSPRTVRAKYKLNRCAWDMQACCRPARCEIVSRSSARKHMRKNKPERYACDMWCGGLPFVRSYRQYFKDDRYNTNQFVLEEKI